MSKDSHPVADMVIRLYPELLARLRRRTHAADPEDLVQDLYLRLRGLPKGETIRRPHSYLMRAADHLAIDRHRSTRHIQPAEAGDPVDLAPGIERQIDARRRLSILRATVEALPERQRDAFVLAKYHNLSQDEIALRMGISRSGVEKLLVKALARCRAALEDMA